MVTEITARRNGQNLFGQAYFWTATGNLSSRADMMLNFVESFTYDRFNRLTSASVGPLSKPPYNNDSYNYDTKGNVVQKDGVGVYAYEHETNPYAVTGMSPNPLVIDRLADQTVDYTPFDKISSISQDGKSLTVNYGIDRQRVIQSFTDGNITKTKRYFTPLYEEVTENGVTKKLHYLTSATGLFAIFVSTSNGGGTMHYTLKDHQGSLAAVVRGNTVERLSYDPWGRRRNTTNFGYDNVSHTFDRGYTLHEHYDEFDLINMNGRMYDPVMSSFLSVDQYVQSPENAQGFNRYAYCMNNPLRYVDPSGWLAGGGNTGYFPNSTANAFDPYMFYGHTALEPRDLGLRQLDTSDPIITWMKENSLHGSGNGVKGESSDSKEQGEGEKYIFGYSDPNAVKVKGPGACLFASLGMICKRLNQWNLDPVFWKEQEALYFAEKEQHGYDSNNIEDFVQWVGENNNIGFSFEKIGIMNIPDANKEKSQVIIVIELSSEKQIAQNEGNKGHVAVLNSFTISSVNGYTSLKMTFGDPSPQRFLYNYNTTSPYILPEGINSWIFYKFNINNYMKP